MNTKPTKGSRFTSMTRKKVGMLVASFIVFVATLSILIYEGTKNTVALQLDGEEVIVKTHAATVGEVLADLNVQVSDVDYLSLPVSASVDDDLSIVWEPAQKVFVQVDEQKESIWTTAKTVNELLKQENITIKEHDKINFSMDDPIKENHTFVIERAFPLSLKNGTEEEKEFWTTSTTVADFLKQQGVTLGELDKVEPALEKDVEPNGIINVIRVEKVTDVVEESIDYKVVTKKDDSLLKGNEKIVQQGKEGLLEKQYEVIKENGVEVERKLVSEKTVSNSQDKIVAVGTKVIVAQSSRGSSSNASNKAAPSGGKEMYVSASAYTASCNGCSGITATGFNLKANPNAKIIAVDPNVIPLGSKVWVEGYGHAIASDTGGAIKGNKIDIFFPSKEQAYKFGRKKVKIRILD